MTGVGNKVHKVFEGEKNDHHPYSSQWQSINLDMSHKGVLHPPPIGIPQMLMCLPTVLIVGQCSTLHCKRQNLCLEYTITQPLIIAYKTKPVSQSSPYMEAGLISIMAYNLGTKMLLILIPTLQPLQHYVKFLLISNELNTVLSSNIISIYTISRNNKKN